MEMIKKLFKNNYFLYFVKNWKKANLSIILWITFPSFFVNKYNINFFLTVQKNIFFKECFEIEFKG